jgi:CRISPR-associated protein Cst2
MSCQIPTFWCSPREEVIRKRCNVPVQGLCPACAVQDGRRAAALIQQPEYKDWKMEHILHECVLCDTHGFLITAKNASGDGEAEARQKVSKHSLVEFSFALALPSAFAETVQLTTRMGDSKGEGQMLMKMPSRSGIYAMCIRYQAVGIGVDTEQWRAIVTNSQERQKRHQVILTALRDYILSPVGALTSTMLPHLTGLTGAVVVRTIVGRAPIYSPLEDDFIERLRAMQTNTCHALVFSSVDEFHGVMGELIEQSQPCLPAPRMIQSLCNS